MAERILENCRGWEIAVISGIESNLNRNSTRNSYKKSSDLIRIVESDLGSTPVIEGGLMGWRLDYLSGFKLQSTQMPMMRK